jgi:hypothetical protein
MNRSRMARLALVTSVLISLLLVAEQAAAAPPSNNRWPRAITILSLPYSNTQSPVGANAGGEPQPSCAGSGSTVWYVHTQAQPDR